MSLADILPSYITDILASREYEDFIHTLQSDYALSEEQIVACEGLIFDLFRKKINPENLLELTIQRVGLSEEQSKKIARIVMLNIVIAFHYFFGDHSSAYAALGGDLDQDVDASPLLRALSKRTMHIFERYAPELARIDFSKEENAMRMLFAKHLVDHLYTPDGEYKVRLNDTILALLRIYDAYHEKLLGALYENMQEIGAREIALPDGTEQRPTVANWIKDFLGYSKGDVSSIALAKYVSENKNARALEAKDKDALRRLLETFIVLKNFPDSLNSIPEDQWKIIPYYHTEEATKIPKVSVIPSEAQRSRGIKEGSEATGSLPSVRDDVVSARDDMASARDDVEAEMESGTNVLRTIEPDTISNAVIQKSGVILADEIRERVKKIVETRVRNVRNDIDTRDRLTSAVADGGAGLAAVEAEKILGEIKIAMKAVAEGPVSAASYGVVQYAEKKGKDVIPSEAQRSRGIKEGSEATGSLPSVRDDVVSARDDKESARDDTAPKMVIKEVDGVPMIVEKPVKNGKKQDVIPSEAQRSRGIKEGSEATGSLPSVRDDVVSARDDAQKTPELTQELAPVRAGSGTDFAGAKTEPDPKAKPSSQTPFSSPPLPVSVPQHLEGAQEIPVKIKQSTAKMESMKMGSDTISQTKLSQTPFTQKKLIPDIKKPQPPRLVGLTDELRALTIKDLRRISEHPAQACQKIADKINALAKESLSKRAEAINAWKESPLYALYLEIGQFNFSQDMDTLAQERKSAGKDYLTSEEFDALLDMNEKLRF